MIDDINRQSFKSLEEKYDAKTPSEKNSEYENELPQSAQQILLPRYKLSKKFMRLLYIAIGVVVATIVITTIVVASRQKANTYSVINLLENTSDGETIDFSNALVLTCGNRSLCILNPKIMNYNTLHGVSDNIVTFDLHPRNGLVWIKENITKIRAHLIDDLNITYSEKLKPQALAVDFITEKLYVVDQIAGTLNIIDLRHKYYGIALSDLINPHDIALDLQQGLMFILQLGHSILRANMDASSSKTIIENDKISAMVINRKTRRIYWVKSGKYQSIESSNYEGKNSISLTPISTNTYSLALFNGQLFWLSENQYNKSIISSCTIRGMSCENHSSHELPFESRIMKSFTVQNLTSIENPCKYENGNCEHLCLLGLPGRRSCNCKLGWKLQENSSSCEHVIDFLMYAQGNFFRGRVLDDDPEVFVDDPEVFVDVIAPTRFFVGSLDDKSTIDFDKSWIPNEVFFCDDHNIYKLNIDDGRQSKMFRVKNGHYIGSLAVDWISENLYYFEISCYDYYRYTVQVLCIKEGRVFKKTIYESPIQGRIPIFRNKRVPLSIAINTRTGELTFTSVARPGYILTHLGGELQEHFSGMDIFTVDYKINALSDFPINNPFMRQARKMCVYQAWKFVSNLTSIWRFEKFYYEEPKRIAPKIDDDLNQKIAGVKIYSSFINVLESEQRCAVNNGGCEQFCFIQPSGSSENSCGCEDGSQLLENGRCS